jgi:hypothetical protein
MLVIAIGGPMSASNHHIITMPPLSSSAVVVVVMFEVFHNVYHAVEHLLDLVTLIHCW